VVTKKEIDIFVQFFETSTFHQIISAHTCYHLPRRMSSCTDLRECWLVLIPQKRFFVVNRSPKMVYYTRTRCGKNMKPTDFHAKILLFYKTNPHPLSL